MRKDIYDLAQHENVANILKKIKEGKTLTASDNRALENHRRKEQGLRPKKTEQELAKEFGIDAKVETEENGCQFTGKLE